MPHDRFDKLPFVIRRKHKRWGWRILQLVLIAICAVMVGSSKHEITAEPLLLVMAVGAALVLIVEIIMRRRGRRAVATTTVDRTGVQKTSLEDSWIEALSAYEGVLWHEELVSTAQTGGGSRTTRYRILDLKHRTKPERTVRLLYHPGETGVRAAWEAAAGALGLPALRQLDDGQTIRREAADLDKNLRQMVEEGRVEAARPASTLPPEGITWSPNEPQQARVRQPEGFLRMGFFIAVGLALFGGVMGVILETWGPAILLIPVVVMYANWKWGHYRVGLIDGQIAVKRLIGGLTLRTRRLLPAEIEQIWTENDEKVPTAYTMQRLMVESDALSVRMSPLTPEMAGWLQSFLQRLIVEAPDT